MSFEVDTAKLDDVLQHLTAAGVRSLISRPPTLEELFLRHYEDAGGGPMSALAGTGLADRASRCAATGSWLPFWIYFFTALAVGTAYSSRAAFGTRGQAARLRREPRQEPLAAGAVRPVSRTRCSVGSVSVWKVGGIAAGLVGVMSMLTRHPAHPRRRGVGAAGAASARASSDGTPRSPRP